MRRREGKKEKSGRAKGNGKKKSRERRRSGEEEASESKVTLNAPRYHVREHLGGSFFVTRYAFSFGLRVV